MARYPGALWRPLPDRTAPIAPTQAILHSAVSNADSLFPYFSRSDVGVESHFYVRRDGFVEQMVDTGMRADANYKANSRAVSIETWDGGDPDKTPWTPQQIDAMARLLAWLHHTHGIPLTRTTAWDSPGVGGHSDYPGIWTPVRGKTCPGLIRRPQVDDVIAAARVIAAPDNPPPREGTVPTMMIVKFGGSKWRLITGDRIVGVTEEFASQAIAAGIPYVGAADGGPDHQALEAALVKEA